MTFCETSSWTRLTPDGDPVIEMMRAPMDEPNKGFHATHTVQKLLRLSSIAPFWYTHIWHKPSPLATQPFCRPR